jgi:hypothetical protein
MELLGVAPLPSLLSSPINDQINNLVVYDQIVDGINDNMSDLKVSESCLNFGKDNSSIDLDPDEI